MPDVQTLAPRDEDTLEVRLAESDGLADLEGEIDDERDDDIDKVGVIVIVAIIV